MFGFTFAIHHVFPRELFDRFGAVLDDLFGGGANNPFRTNSVLNTNALPSSEGLADALRILPDGSVGQTVFGALLDGTGIRRLGDFHSGYNDSIHYTISPKMHKQMVPRP